jgi:uncharacterized membrane protein YkoI
MKTVNIMVTLVLTAIVAGSSAVYAQGMAADGAKNNLTHQRQGGQSQPGAAAISSAEAARIAGNQTGGRVLEVTPRSRGYDVKVYVQGKVRNVFVDAKR